MGKRAGLAVGIFGAVLMAGSVLAQAHPGGGGGHGGGVGGHVGGGHGGGGGGHAAAAPHYGGGGGGAHFASAAHYSGAGGHAAGGYRGASRGYAGGYAGAAYHGGAGGYAGGYRGSAYAAGRGYGGGYRGGYGGGYGGYRGYHGYSAGAFWGGGYWRGGYWPRAYYGPGYAWFLGALPLAYATYWYGGVPYYYANNLYYTWSPDYSGYVATDPPPVADASGAAPVLPPTADASYQGDPNAQAAPPPPQAGAADFSQAQAAPQEGQGPPPGDQGMQQGGQAPAQVAYQGQQPRMFMYPKSGQTEDQQRTDKLECEKWASDQVGLGNNGADYQRAMGACVQGRGYGVN
jgi:hypothetical protein